MTFLLLFEVLVVLAGKILYRNSRFHNMCYVINALRIFDAVGCDSLVFVFAPPMFMAVNFCSADKRYAYLR